jgi:hypothetical protein
MRPLVGLIAARLRRRGLATLLVPAAVAPAAFALLATGPASLIAEDAALEDALRRAPAAARTVRVDVTKTANSQLSRDGGLPGLDAETDQQARAALTREGTRGATGRGVLFSGVSGAGGTELRLLAVDDPARRLRLSAGRRPAPCEQRVCEAVILGGARAPSRRELRLDGLALRLVGAGRLDSAVLGAVPPRETAQPGQRPSAFLGGAVREGRRAPLLMPHRDSDAARASSDRVHVVPMHRMQRLRPSGTSAGRPELACADSLIPSGPKKPHPATKRRSSARRATTSRDGSMGTARGWSERFILSWPSALSSKTPRALKASARSRLER